MARRINKKKKKKYTGSGKTTIPMHSMRVDALLVTASNHLIRREYEETARICESLLSYVPQGAKQRAEVLYYYGLAQGFLENFQQAYDAYTEALSIDPGNVDLWYNRGMASRFTSRFGRSLRDYEQAAVLNTDLRMTQDIEKRLAESRDLVQKSLVLRGPDFTLDQLIQQEDLFQDGLALMEQEKWQEAEEAFRQSIALGDCLPQPWGNIAGCYLLQGRFDEAEALYKRALEIDPGYDIALQNLEFMPQIRKEGIPSYEIREPFKGAGLKQTMTILPE